jgi:hypothetical protein
VGSISSLPQLVWELGPRSFDAFAAAAVVGAVYLISRFMSQCFVCMFSFDMCTLFIIIKAIEIFSLVADSVSEVQD